MMNRFQSIAMFFTVGLGVSSVAHSEEKVRPEAGTQILEVQIPKSVDEPVSPLRFVSIFIEFRNESNYRIDEIYTTKGSIDNWNDDKAPFLIYPEGSWTFDTTSNECVWDAKAVLQNGDEVTGFDLDYCKEPYIAITNDRIY